MEKQRAADGGGLAPCQVERYWRDGIIFPVPVLQPAEVASCRAAFDRLAGRLGDDATYVGQPHLFFRWAFELAVHPRILGAAASLLGPDLLIHGTLLLAKPPRHPGLIRWHQDGQSGFNAVPNVSAWIALSHSTAANGCMRVVPGSHRWPRLPHVASRHEHKMLARGLEIAVEVDEAQAADVVLQAGEMSFHHADIVHGSAANLSNEWRIGFIVRFVTPELASYRGPVVRALGQAECGHLELLREPPGDDFEAGVEGCLGYKRNLAPPPVAGMDASGAAAGSDS